MGKIVAISVLKVKPSTRHQTTYKQTKFQFPNKKESLNTTKKMLLNSCYKSITIRRLVALSVMGVLSVMTCVDCSLNSIVHRHHHHEQPSAVVQHSSHRHSLSNVKQLLENDERENRKQIWNWIDQFQSDPKKENEYMEQLLSTQSRPDDIDSVEVDYFDITESTTPKPVKLKRSSSNSIRDVLKFSSNRNDAKLDAELVPKTTKRPTSSVLNLPPVKPEWSFECPANESGYFADVENDCRVYYMCVHDRRERQRFQCPLGTRFNQKSSNCDWWDKVQCSGSSL